MSTYHFHLHNLAYDEQVIVDDCSFALEKGKIAAFIGPSGCGKTTLLNAIAGLKTFEHINTPQHLSVGYIFQESRLIPWLSVAENLVLVKPDISQEEIMNSLASVKLQDVANDYPVALSGGMQKRVSIARCFVTKPELVLLDEPFSSVDTPTAQHLISLVNELLRNSQSSAILVTHNITEALQLADTVYFLSTKPTRIIKAIDVPESATSAEKLASQVLEKYPDILSGRIE